MRIFQYQYSNNRVYKTWNDILQVDIASISSLSNIPFLPISFFKTHKIVCSVFQPEYIFESSGTTQSVTSRHYVKDAALYRKSFLNVFKIFYGDLKDVLLRLENNQQKTLLIGVSFALLDFAEQYPLQLKYTTVMETGGMKGRRKEITRQEMHSILCNNLGINKVHSEYGMTELLSQAYSKGDGIFYCPPWMKVFVRGEDDPLLIRETGRGVLNIIDLANIYSCSFIATDDVGTVYEDGSFEVIGRMDNSDVRGCSLMTV